MPGPLLGGLRQSGRGVRGSGRRGVAAVGLRRGVAVRRRGGRGRDTGEETASYWTYPSVLPPRSGPIVKAKNFRNNETVPVSSVALFLEAFEFIYSSDAALAAPALWLCCGCTVQNRAVKSGSGRCACSCVLKHRVVFKVVQRQLYVDMISRRLGEGLDSKCESR